VVHLVEEEQADEFSRAHFGGAMKSFGRMVAFHGQMGMFTRALSYILSHGPMALPRSRRQRPQRQLHPAQP
jgi:glycine dehydrogenase subunit 2